MKKTLHNVLMTVLTLALLLGAAVAVPQAGITDVAREAYLNEAPALDDEYAFLFEE